jgi:hypothetical protein
MSEPKQQLNIDDLRERLFKTIDDVRSGSMEPDRARVVGQLAKVVVDSARAEVEFLKLSGQDHSAFLTPNEAPQVLPPGITGIRRHRLAG